ncbi:MAG: hypothetical protein PHS92_05135 [Candidatus Gracilibacteria bacterium]|nr:hypothetical protein [Candidatus Gracilibacteria bacterium]
MDTLSDICRTTLENEFLSGEFIYCNFYRQITIPERIKERFGNCIKLCERVGEKIQQSGFSFSFLTSENSHVVLKILDKNGETYLFDPTMGQLSLIPLLTGGKSLSAEANTMIILSTQQSVGHILCKQAAETVRYYTFRKEGVENFPVNGKYIPPQGFVGKKTSALQLKIVFHISQKKVSLIVDGKGKYIKELDKDGMYKINEFTEKCISYEQKLKLPRNTFSELFGLASS